jgi:hypothetical protein
MARGEFLKKMDAIAMLIGDGWWYDKTDHTFNSPADNADGRTMIDADTMELMPYQGSISINNSEYQHRVKRVEKGEIGYNASHT